jgi:SAM-dependent methyltransferase
MRFQRHFALLATAATATLLLAQERTPDVPYVPSPNEVVDAMLKLANVKKGDIVYDLGCGDGRIVIAAAKLGARGVGVDINPERIQEATENARKAGVTNQVKFVKGDLFEADIKDATVVTLYLLPGVNQRLKPRLLADLKPGTRVVSHSFDMGEWKPEKTADVNGRTIYYWVIPAKGAAAASAR